MFGESGIKIASIIIGLIVIVGIIIVANRYGSQIKQRLNTTKISSLKVTPTPSVITPTEIPDSFGQIVGQTKGEITYNPPSVAQIPSTGAEIVVIPALISLLGIGLKLRRLA